MVTIENFERRNANGDILYPGHSGYIYNSKRRDERMKKSTILFIISTVLTIGEVATYIAAVNLSDKGE